MLQVLNDLLLSQGFVPHGYCLSWSPQLIWSMVAANAIIGLSYYSIPLGLMYFVRQHRELRFNWLLVMFSLFIFACGTTHFIDIINIWRPVYRLDAVVKILTATVSIMTAVALWPLLPKISAFMADRRRAFEAVEASNRELEEFAYAVSHDLKSPLRSIGSFAGLLERRFKGPLDKDAAEFLGFIKSAVAQMNALIEDLLRLSQVNRGQFKTQPTAAADALRTAREMLRAEIDASGAVVEHGTLPEVPADPRLLASLFQNLISNGIKFRRAGVRPWVHVEARQQGAEWLFSVIDNGIGIAAEHRDKLFQVFKRLHTAEEYPGTGIGLVMCQKIVALHHGRIWIEPTTGEGATLCFTLPIRAPVEMPVLQPAEPAAAK